MKEWFVVQTHYNLEDLALNNIKKSGFEVYCPKYLKTITHARQTKKVLKPLFPRYIFVSFNKKNNDWIKINYLRGVSSLIMNNKYTSSLPIFFIKDLKNYELKNGVINLYEYIKAMKKNNKFKFLFSKQKLIDGISTGVEKANYVRLLINLFGRELYCWVSKKKIEAV